MATCKPNARQAGDTTLRHVWLAGLGLASLLRPDAITAAGRILAQTLRRRPRVGAADRRAFDPAAPFDEGLGARFAPVMRRLALRPRSGHPAVQARGRAPRPARRGGHTR